MDYKPVTYPLFSYLRNIVRIAYNETQESLSWLIFGVEPSPEESVRLRQSFHSVVAPPAAPVTAALEPAEIAGAPAAGDATRARPGAGGVRSMGAVGVPAAPPGSLTHQISRPKAALSATK